MQRADGHAVAASSITTFYIKMAIGNLIRQVNASNGTKAEGLISLALTDKDNSEAQVFSLIHREPQRGISDVSWQGQIEIKDPFVYVRCQAELCDVGDVVDMTVGYE